MVTLKPVTEFDYHFMYDMLKERKPEEVISFKMPSYHQHVKFIESKPYKAWYIILEDDFRVGNIYLTHNDEWGYFIKKESQNLGIGTKALKELVKLHPRKYYYANINPDNKVAIHQARDKFKGKLIQITYKISINSL